MRTIRFQVYFRPNKFINLLCQARLAEQRNKHTNAERIHPSSKHRRRHHHHTRRTIGRILYGMRSAKPMIAIKSLKNSKKPQIGRKLSQRAVLTVLLLNKSPVEIYPLNNYRPPLRKFREIIADSSRS
jgi:hypothetical protein